MEKQEFISERDKLIVLATAIIYSVDIVKGAQWSCMKSAMEDANKIVNLVLNKEKNSSRE